MPLYKSLILLLASSSSILAVKYFFFLFLKCLLTSRLTLFKSSALLWHGNCTHYIFARFLCSKKPKHSSSKQGLFCLNSSKPRPSFAEVWILCIFNVPQILVTSSSSFKFSKAGILLVISIFQHQPEVKFISATRCLFLWETSVIHRIFPFSKNPKGVILSFDKDYIF